MVGFQSGDRNMKQQYNTRVDDIRYRSGPVEEVVFLG
jgi:hypothetical protein